MTQRPIPAFSTADGAAPNQWTIESMQLVNWGGFDGYHYADLDVRAVLLTGASGTGKSTLLDAYIALMMKSNIPFNGASNDNTVGRARGADQRHVLSYTRGKYNTSRDPDSGQAKDEVLRGDGTNTWSAIAVTWRNETGTLFTAMRYYLTPGTARRPADVKFHMATFPNKFDLREIESFAANNFHHGKMGSRFTGLVFHNSYEKFAEVLHKRLGIGAYGDGALAMQLLARIQGGRQVTSVDSLYKDMVLEQPHTYSAAERAVEHFAALEESYETMRTAEQQIETLKNIPALHAALTRAEAEVNLIDTFRVQEHTTVTPDPDTPLSRWAYGVEADLLTVEITANKVTAETADKQATVSRRAVNDLEKELSENQHQQRENGGDALEQLDRDLGGLTLTLRETEGARAVYADRVSVLGGVPDDVNAHTVLRDSAREFLGAYTSKVNNLDTQIMEVVEETAPLKVEMNDLLGEQRYLLARKNLIPQPLHDARVEIAEHLGMDPDDLPFVAELLDMDPEHEQWREAAELVLGGFAKTLLVDRSTGSGFRRKINSLRLRQRINFTIADTNKTQRPLDAATLAGKFQFKETSKFTGWLTEQLGNRFDHECVLDASGFAEDRRRRVTLAGQTQDGDRGAHGGQQGHRPILGFSNTRRLSEITERLTALDATIRTLAGRREALQQQRNDMETLRTAHQFVLDTDWVRVDVSSVQERINSKEKERDRILAASDVLPALKERETEILSGLDDHRRSLHMAEASMEALTVELGVLYEREDKVKDRLYELEDDPTLELTEDHLVRLATEYDNAATNRNHAEFKSVLAAIRRTLTAQVDRARTEVTQTSNMLTAAFTAFNRSWPQPNLGTGVESYDGYRTILDRLVGDGLGERKDRFAQKVLDWSGEDLLGLHRAYDEATDEIEDRLVPVNEILATLPFGRGNEQLQITLTKHRNDDIQQFRSELRSLASNTTLLIDGTAIEARFKQLRKFIDRIRPEDPNRVRDHLLDVRRHVYVEAVTLGAGGEPTAVYNSLGGKSGGETQELIAFIVGAALRYQLGNADRKLPIYAPVFLDEGFVKADSQFAGRAVSAWRGLGFQLIIGAPLDKVTAIEPYMERTIQVTKAANGYSYLSDITPVDA